MKKTRFYLLTFLIPFGVMLGICIAKGVYPFGKNSFMHCDMYHQYVPFLVEFWRKLHTGASFSWDWNLGLGSEFVTVFAYYLATPTNWLVYFCPEHLIIEFMTLMILIKISLCGVTFACYLRNRFGVGSPVILAFSTLYALSGFVAAYNWNHMWLDVVWLAPLVILGLERLVKQKKCVLYCLALAASIFTNYYLSIMLCIFLVFYFVVLLFTSGLKWRAKGGAVFRFGLYSLLGGGMAAVLLLPVLLAMRATGYDDSAFPATLEFYFNGLEVVTRHFLTIPKEIGLDHWPNVYCGISVFVLIPLYLFCGRIPLRQRIAKVLLAVFLLLSFSANILNFLWHGFNYPNSLPARQSYLYVFLLLSMGYEVVLRSKKWKLPWLFAATFVGCIVMALCSIFVTTEGFTVKVAAISWCFFCLYIALGVLQFLLPKHRKILMWITIVLFVGEAATNMYQTSVPVVQRKYYATKWENYENLLEKAKEESGEEEFYRFQSFCYMTKNDGMLAGYPGISIFSSTTNTAVKDFYNKMGMEGTKVSYYSEGSTALTSALLGVRYTFSEKEEGEELYRLVAESGKMKLYENKYTLPVGIGLGGELADEIEKLIHGGNSNNIQAQNKIAAKLGVTGNLFLYQGKGSELKVERDGYYYAYIHGDGGDTILMNPVMDVENTDVGNADIENADVNSASRESQSVKFDGLKKNCLIDLGHLEKGSSWIFTSQDEEKQVQAWVYRLDESALEKAITKLGENPFCVTSYKEGYLNGKITMKEAGKLFLSVPAVDGWIITVDGQEVSAGTFMDAFICIPLEEGEHTVTLRFETNGWKAGLGISLLSAAIFAGTVFIRKKREKAGKVL